MEKNIRNQLNNTKEELKKINRQTKININQMQEVLQEILNIKSYQQEIEETIPSWKPILFPVPTREAAYNSLEITSTDGYGHQLIANKALHQGI